MAIRASWSGSHLAQSNYAEPSSPTRQISVSQGGEHRRAHFYFPEELLAPLKFPEPDHPSRKKASLTLSK